MKLRSIEREIRFVGLKRSGNHAVLNWIGRQLPGSLMHFNNARPEDPYDLENRTRATHPERAEQDTVIYSIEDTSLRVIGDPRSYPRREVHPGLRVGRRIDVLLLRDPFNLMASRFKRGASWGHMSTYFSGLTAPQMWVMYAREYLGQTAWLPPGCVRVNYNRWCRSVEYRRQLARQLGIPFTDAGFEEVTGFGGGSSFEHTALDGRASAMRTDRRWQAFREDTGFRALFRDPLLLDLARRIFELDDDLRSFVDSELCSHATRRAVAERQLRARLLEPVVTPLRRSGLVRQLYRGIVSPLRRKRLPLPRSSHRAAT